MPGDPPRNVKIDDFYAMKFLDLARPFVQTGNENEPPLVSDARCIIPKDYVITLLFSIDKT